MGLSSARTAFVLIAAMTTSLAHPQGIPDCGCRLSDWTKDRSIFSGGI